MVVRREEAGAAIEEAWGVLTYRTVEELVAATSPAQLEFVQVCVSGDANAPMLIRLAPLDEGALSHSCSDCHRLSYETYVHVGMPYIMQSSMGHNGCTTITQAELGVPAMSQTALPGTAEELAALYEQLRGARVQVAEQYLFQPIHQARLAVLASGRLGTVSHAQVSAAHGYHGASPAAGELSLHVPLCASFRPFIRNAAHTTSEANRILSFVANNLCSHHTVVGASMTGSPWSKAHRCCVTTSA